MDTEKVKFRFWIKILVAVALLTLGVIHFDWLCKAVQNLYSIVSPFLIGGLIAFILNIPMRKIEQVLFAKAKGKFANKIKRPVGIILTLAFMILLVTMLGLLVIPQLGTTVEVLRWSLPGFYESSLNWLMEMMQKYPDVTETLRVELQKIMDMEIDWQKLLTTVSDFFVNGFGGSFIKNTFSMAGKIGGGIVNTVIAVIFSIYLLAQKEKLASQGKRILSAYMNEKMYARTMRVVTLLSTNFSNFIAGQCIEAVILGLMIMIPMLILGFDYAFLIGVLVGVSSLIPVVGAFVGCGVGAFLFLIQDPVTALWFVLLFLIVQQIEGNLIYPYVVGNSVGLPSLWILAAITIGGSLMGVAGMLFFIPLFSTFYTLLRDSVNEKNSEKMWVRAAWATNYLPQSVKEMQKRKNENGFFGFGKSKKQNAGPKEKSEAKPENIPVKAVQPTETKVQRSPNVSNAQNHKKRKRR